VKALRLEGIGRLGVEEVHKPRPDPHDRSSGSKPPARAGGA